MRWPRSFTKRERRCAQLEMSIHGLSAESAIRMVHGVRINSNGKCPLVYRDPCWNWRYRNRHEYEHTRANGSVSKTAIRTAYTL